MKKELKAGAVHFLNLSKYEAPQIMESTNKDYVTYGKNNSFFAELINLFRVSPTNNAVLNSINRQTYGKGLYATDAKRYPTQYAKAKNMFRDKEVRRSIEDFNILANTVLMIDQRGKSPIIKHVPAQMVAPAVANENGEIERFFYSPDLGQAEKGVEKDKYYSYKGTYFGTGRNSKNEDEIISYPNFDLEPTAKISIKYIRPYTIGTFYFASPPYMGGIPYMEAEKQISIFHIANIMGGFSGLKVVNFNNGVPSESDQVIQKNKIMEKLTGPEGENVIVSFQHNQDQKITVDTIPIDNPHEQYEFMANECTEKIMLVHGVVSPILFGVKNNSGFGNNAEELEKSSLLNENMSINPRQEALIDGYNEVFHYFDISLDWYFKTIQPFEFKEVDAEVQSDEDIEKETGVEMSAEKVCCSANDGFPDEEGAIWTKELKKKGEVINEDEYVLIHEEEVTEANTDFSINNLFEFAIKNGSSIKSDAEDKSSKDKGLYKVRYRYSPATTQSNSRDFCKEMVGMTKEGVVWRIEDINQMSFKGVNKNFGHKKQSYSLFLYKGGPYCRHKWMRLIFVRKRDKGRFEPKSKTNELENDRKTTVVGAAKAGAVLPKTARDAKAAIKPRDMQDNGHHPDYKG